jgi:integrase
MARQPKPWYRTDRKVWCVTINGKRHNLGRTKKEAFDRFYAMMRQPRREKVVSGDTLPAIFDAFLDWCQQSRSAATYRWYQDHLQSFVAHYPDLTFEQLRPLHIETWSAVRCTNVNTRRNRMRAIKRSLRWATFQGYIEHNPIAGLEIPAAQPREVYVSPDEFKQLLSFVRDDSFADLLRITYETGCRPQESLRLEARHVDLDRARWVFPRQEANLSEYALAISRKLVETCPSGPLFRNTHDKAWNSCSISCAFDRIQIRMGKEVMQRSDEAIEYQAVAELAKTLQPERVIQGVLMKKTQEELLNEARKKLTHQLAKQHAPRYSLYALRHSWATNALKSGVDALTVAILMGHKDPSTLARTYQHLSHNPEHLLAEARRATG